MVKNNFKVLVTDGDSWTAGDIVDPEIFGNDKSHVNKIKNRPYRLPRVWPNKLGNLLGIDTINLSEAGSSNDAIVRRIIGNVPTILKEFDSSEILVIIGLTSPERKDFYFKNDQYQSWETLYPSELNSRYEIDEKNKFYQIYGKYYWNEEEYLSRYILQVITIHNYLLSKNINHLFFNAFYEPNPKLDSNGINSKKTLYDLIRNIDKIYSETAYKLDDFENNFKNEFLKIYEKFFIKKTFKEKLLNELGELDQNLFEDLHPNELGHEIWSKYLFKTLKNYKNYL